MKLRRKMLRVFTVLGALLLLGSAGIPQSVNAATNETKKTFTVGFDAEFPPYGYKDSNGQYVGFDLDLAQEVCNRRGWTLKKQPIEWDSKDMELNSNSIDCIWNGFTINGLENDYTWSNPYIDNSQVVLVKKESGIEKLSDLAGKVVVVQSASSAQAALTGKDATQKNQNLAASFGDLQEVADYNSAVMNLESGAVDAICMDMGVAMFQQGKHASLNILKDSISSEGYGIGFKKGNTELRDQVQETLFEMLDDGTIKKIAEKYNKYNLAESICLQHDGAEATATPAPVKASSKKLAVSEVMRQLVSGFGATLSIFFMTLIFSLPLGLLVAFGRMSKISVIRWIAKIYISIMRGTPLMLQLLVVFFGPYYIFRINLGDFGPHYRFIAVIIGFSLNYAAYFAEIYRSGIENIPDGQREAAKLLGYSRAQTFRKIIFPQMVKRVMPPVTNEIITLVKDTSLAFVLSYTEMFTLAKHIAASMTNVMPIFVAGIFYYIFNYLVAFIMELIEKKMNYYQ